MSANWLKLPTKNPAQIMANKQGSNVVENLDAGLLH